MTRTRWPPICESRPLAQARQIRTGSAGGCLTRPGRRAGIKTTHKASGRTAGQTGAQSRTYARTHANPRKQGRRLYPHPPCRIGAIYTYLVVVHDVRRLSVRSPRRDRRPTHSLPVWLPGRVFRQAGAVRLIAAVMKAAYKAQPKDRVFTIDAFHRCAQCWTT
jgi:hypothetical protein